MSVVITLSKEALPHVLLDQQGIKRSFYVQTPDLIRFLEQACDTTEIKPKVETLVVSPALPLNTVKYSKLSDDTQFVFLQFAEKSENVRYHADTYQQVPFPKMVFGFNVKGKKLIQTHVAVYKDTFLRDDTILYKYPYSNVYGDGKLCFYGHEEVIDLVQLQTFPYRWLKEENNDHLYHQNATNSLNKPLCEVFQSSQNESFNYEMLRPMDITFHEWSHKICQ